MTEYERELVETLRAIVNEYVPVRDMREIEHMPLQSPSKVAAILAARRALSVK